MSKAGVTKLRHGNPRDFTNGVAMDIESFVDYMIYSCKWIQGGSRKENDHRYKSSEFDTKNFTC